MQAPRRKTENAARPGGAPGIIDTLGNAFALLNRRPYLVWLPIVFDIVLWSGFRLSVIDPLAWAATRLNWMPAALGVKEEKVSTWFADAELISLTGALIPTLIGDLARVDVESLSIASGANVAGEPGFGLLLATAILSLVVGISYLTMIGRLVNDRPAWGRRFAGDCGLNTLRAVGLVLSALALVVFLFVPFLALGFALRGIGLDPLFLLYMVGITFLIWTGIFFVFGLHALALGESGPFHAMRLSYTVVRRHFLSVLGLLLIIVLIRAGTPLALQVFTETRWSVPFAIVVNAYVATGLIAATMIYFRDRASDSFSSPVAMNAAGAFR